MEAVFGLDPALGLPLSQTEEHGGTRVTIHRACQQQDRSRWNMPTNFVAGGVAANEPSRLDRAVATLEYERCL